VCTFTTGLGSDGFVSVRFLTLGRVFKVSVPSLGIILLFLVDMDSGSFW